MIGYGNSMFLATHGILARTASGGGVDPDAQAFITAASITDPTQQSAINQLVVDLKGYGVWTKMKALYPFVGGTAAQHKWNLKDPRDLDVAFRLVFSGGITHSSSGVDPNGVNGTADTKMTSASLGTSSLSMWYYSREDIITNALIGSLNKLMFIPKLAANGYSYYALNCDLQANNTAGWAPSNYTGLLGLNRTGTTDFKAWRNGASYKTLATVTGAGTEAGNVTLFQRNVVGQYTANQCAFAALGDGLTDTEAANFYTAVQAFQVALGRSIGTQTVSDADAQAFVTNAGIVDQVEANAVNNLVIGLKADSLWTKMKAVYPFVGGTSTTNSYNLKNTAQYQITWAGGVTHASTGVTFNGTNGYANTNFAPNSALTANSNHVSLYSRTAAARSQTFSMDFGQGTDLNISNGIFGCSRRLSGNAIYGATNASAQGSVTAANTNGSGMFVNSITSSTSRKIYRNAVTLGTLTTNISQTLSAPNMFIGADNNNGSPNLYSDYQAAFFSIGDGLDDTEATNLNSRVTTFQTTLNRL